MVRLIIAIKNEISSARVFNRIVMFIIIKRANSSLVNVSFQISLRTSASCSIRWIKAVSSADWHRRHVCLFRQFHIAKAIHKRTSRLVDSRFQKIKYFLQLLSKGNSGNFRFHFQ